jgi:hypothetical protein
MTSPPISGPTVTPELSYANARQAIQLLIEVLGLEQGLILGSSDGAVAHAELWWHTGVVFVDSVDTDDENGVQTGRATVCLAAESAVEMDSIYDRALRRAGPKSSSRFQILRSAAISSPPETPRAMSGR